MSAARSAEVGASEPGVRGVVAGFDGSPAAHIAVDWAAGAAAAHGLPLTLLMARPDAQADVMDLAQAEAELLVEAEIITMLREVEVRLAHDHPGLPVRSIIHPGSPVDGLLEASETADALVIGSRGLGGFQGLLIGSTAMNVTPYAHCPVVVLYVPDAATAEAVQTARHPDEVVVGFDGSPNAVRALRFAMQHAQVTGLGVLVVYVVKGSGDQEPLAVAPDAADLPPEVREDLGLAAEVAAERPQVPVSYLYGEGSPAGDLIREAAGCPLAVVGARGRGGFRQLLLGSVGLQMLIHAECPVAIVRDLPAD